MVGHRGTASIAGHITKAMQLPGLRINFGVGRHGARELSAGLGIPFRLEGHRRQLEGLAAFIQSQQLIAMPEDVRIGEAVLVIGHQLAGFGIGLSRPSHAAAFCELCEVFWRLDPAI